MKCVKCNSILNETDQICPGCGTSIDELKANNLVINTELNNNQLLNNIQSSSINNEEPVAVVNDNVVVEPVVESINMDSVSVIPEVESPTIRESVVEPVNMTPESVQPSVESVNSFSEISNAQELNSDVTVKPNLVDVSGVIPPVEDSFMGSAEPKKHKSIVGILIAVVVVLLLAIGGFVYYIMHTPKNVFSGLINETYKTMNSSLVEDVKTIKGTYSFNTNISTTNEGNEIFDILNAISLNGDFAIDYEAKTALVKVNSKYENDELVNGDVYFKENKAYVLLNNIYDKYLSMDVENYDDLFAKAEITKDHKIILTEIKSALNKSLKSEYFSQEKVEIEVNGKTEKVTKNTLILNSKNVKEIAKAFLTYLKNSEKFINSASTVGEIEKDDLKTSLEESLADLENISSEEDGTFDISIYTKGIMNSLVKIDVISEDFENSDSKIEIIKNNDSKYTFKISADEETSVSGELNVTENDGKTTLDVKVVNDITKDVIGFTVGYSFEYNKDISSTNVSNSVSMEELTEAEYSSISEKLMNNEGIQKLMTTFQGLISSYSSELNSGYDYNYEDYTDYDYDYDYGDITLGDGVTLE